MINIALIIIVAAVATILLLLKTNAGLVFMSLCSGDVLVQFASKNIAYINGRLNTHLLPRYLSIARPSLLIIILLLPPFLTVLLSKRDQGITRWPIQLLPAIATGLVGALLVVPLLSLHIQATITQNRFWNLLEQYQIPVVGLGVAVSIAAIIIISHGNHSKQRSKT